MKTNIKTSFSRLTLLLIISLGVFISSNVFAQGGPGDDADIPGIPLDGGLSILIAAGAAYGSKKFYDAKKKNEK
jgi:hypothetical protein